MAHLCWCNISCSNIKRNNSLTSSKNCWVLRSINFNSVSSRKFLFRASWFVLISFSSFSIFSKLAYRNNNNNKKTNLLKGSSKCLLWKTDEFIHPRERSPPRRFKGIFEQHGKYSQPSVSLGSIPADSTNHGSKIFGEKHFPESSKEQNLNLLPTSNYLPSIYIVFTTTYIAFTLY